MKEKPRVIYFITSTLLLAPIVASILIYVATHFRQSYITREIQFEFLLFIVGALIVSYGIWKVKTWGYYMLISFGVIIIGMDLQQIISEPNTLNVFDFVDGALVFFGFWAISREKIKAPFFDSKLRWWERAVRVETDVEGAFYLDGEKLDGLILDMSATGCFAGIKPDADLGKLIKTSVEVGGLRFETEAQFVRFSTNPVGVGLRFVNTSKENKVVLKQMLKIAAELSPKSHTI